MTTLLRTLSLVALAGAAFSAHAVDAFNNLGNPVAYATQSFNTSRSPATLFTSSASGLLSSFTVAINDAGGPGLLPYTLNLYTNSATNTLGTLLVSFPGTSTGGPTTGNAVAVVAASGVSLVSGTQYWLEATGPNNGAAWNLPTSGNTILHVDGQYFANQPGTAFSVQVNGQPTPEPATMAALGLGAVAMLRRRKRA